MMETPQELYYSQEHEWARIEADTAIVGITDYAQGELGDVVFVDLPQPGTMVEKGSVFATIEAVKAVADMYAPVSGEIIEINQNLDDSPELVNQSPYIDGWMVKIEMSNPNEIEELMNSEEYIKLIEGK